MRLFPAAFVLAVPLAVPAFSQDKPFEGPSATAIGGIDVSQDYDGPTVGALYGGQLAYDWQSNNTVFGLEGEVTGATARNCVTIYRSSGDKDRFCSKPGRDFYIGGRVGKVLGDSTLLYAKAGYTNLRRTFDYRDGATGSINPSYSASGTSNGFRVGAGIEKRIDSNVTLKTEYRYSNYEGSYSRHQGVVGLGIRF